MSMMAIAEAKAHLSEVVDRALHRKATTVITKHGKPVAAIISFEELERLRTYARSDERRGLGALIRKLPPSDALVEEALLERQRNRLEKPRKVGSLADE